MAGDDELRKRKMQQAAEASSVAADNSRAALHLLELRGQGGSPKRQRQFMDRIQGLVNVPFWEYWTSPYSSRTIYLMVGWCSMGTCGDPWNRWGARQVTAVAHSRSSSSWDGRYRSSWGSAELKSCHVCTVVPDVASLKIDVGHLRTETIQALRWDRLSKSTSEVEELWRCWHSVVPYSRAFDAIGGSCIGLWS